MNSLDTDSLKEPTKIADFTNKLYTNSFLRYIFVGGSTFIIDFGLLYITHTVLNINIALATTIAYWTSIVYNFSLNRQWTFSAADKSSLRKHALYYGLLLLFNYLFTVLFVGIMSQFIYFGIAKVIAVVTQISWTYILYKRYIFTNK